MDKPPGVFIPALPHFVNFGCLFLWVWDLAVCTLQFTRTRLPDRCRHRSPDGLVLFLDVVGCCEGRTSHHTVMQVTTSISV